ncbi:MAG TPA: GNA1162 family protein [Syntrophales bacterium]|nr:GNA1162 family protein [Syntrophales bacterium]
MIRREVTGIIVVLILGTLLLQGCSYMAKVPVIKDLPYVTKPDEESLAAEKTLDAKTIAVMPVDVKAGNRDAARMIRENLIEELYFKGYSKIPMEMVDAALADFRKRDGGASGTTTPPQVIGSMLGVDAVMYTTLVDATTTYKYVYAPVNVAAVFELKSVSRGETIWRYESKAVDRDYGVTKNSLELGTTKIFESLVQEVVKKAMENLPDGPGIK